MVGWLVKRKLADTSVRLRKAREELAVLTEQAEQFEADADDARIRSMVAETPVASREHAEFQRHAEAMSRAKDSLLQRIGELEKQQNDLLDRLSKATK